MTKLEAQQFEFLKNLCYNYYIKEKEIFIMKEIEKLIESGMSVDEILKAAKEAEARVAAKSKKNQEIEKARETLVNAMLGYAKVLGLDLDIEDCSSIISDVTTNLKELEKFVDEMSSFKEKSKCNKREKRTVISDAEADEILKLVKEFFN